MPRFFSMAEMIKLRGMCNFIQSLMHTNFLTKFIIGNGRAPLSLEPRETYHLVWQLCYSLARYGDADPEGQWASQRPGWALHKSRLSPEIFDAFSYHVIWKSLKTTDHNSKCWCHHRTYDHCYCWSVAQACLTVCDSMDYITPGLHVPHHLPKFA